MNAHTRSKPHAAPFARNAELGMLLETVLVWAVVAILTIRFFLALTGFPQLGGHGLHIAHMLWGGLFMLASLVVLLAFLGRRVQRIAAIVGGIGFGTFIDELGKFITSDNDYFFRPTISLIYCIFVLLFLLGRRIEERAPFSRRELVANGLDQIKETVLADGAPLSRRETQLNAQLLRLLHPLGARDPAVNGLVAALQRLDATPTRPATALERVAAGVDARYRRLIRSPRFATFVLTGLIAYALLTLVLLVVALVAAAHTHVGVTLTFAEGGLVATAVLSGTLIGVGVAALPRSRAVAYRWFRYGILVALLLEQVFLFYLLQFGAILGLALNLVVLATLNYGIAAEESPAVAGRDTPQAPHGEREQA